MTSTANASERPSLRPEQRRALAYVRAKGTDAPAAEVRRRVGLAFGELESMMDAVPEELAARRPEPAVWSPHEIVDHLVESHRPAVRQLELLLAGQDPPGGAIPAGLLSQDPLRRPWRSLADELRAVHGDFLALLAGAGDTTPAASRAPVEMVVRCATADGGSEPAHWIEHFPWKAFALVVGVHSREHAAQMRRVLGLLQQGG